MEVTPGHVDARDQEFIDRWASRVSRAVLRYYRADVSGLDNLPRGAFVGVGNHSGAIMIPDTMVWLAAYHQSGRKQLRVLAHDQMFDSFPAPLARWLGRLGIVRARHDIALDALRRGYEVQVYPGGDYDACRSVFRRHEIVFAGRTGYVDLAREAGVPIVPVVSVGGHGALLVLWDGAWLAERLGVARKLRIKTLPVAVSVPWGLTVGPVPGYLPLRTRISVRVLPPIEAIGETEEIDARVRETMQREVDRLVAERSNGW